MNINMCMNSCSWPFFSSRHTTSTLFDESMRVSGCQWAFLHVCVSVGFPSCLCVSGLSFMSAMLRKYFSLLASFFYFIEAGRHLTSLSVSAARGSPAPSYSMRADSLTWAELNRIVFIARITCYSRYTVQRDSSRCSGLTFKLTRTTRTLSTSSRWLAKTRHVPSKMFYCEEHHFTFSPRLTAISTPAGQLTPPHLPQNKLFGSTRFTWMTYFDLKTAYFAERWHVCRYAFLNESPLDQ